MAELTDDALISGVEELLSRDDGSLVLNYDSNRAQDNLWIAGLEWGHESEDSPMVAGAAYGRGSSLREALQRAIDELEA